MAKRILSRHSIKPTESDRESPVYKGISEQGVRLARESARDIIKTVEESPRGSVIFLAGVSDAVRTRSTMAVYAEEVQKHFKGNNNYLFVSSNDLTAGSRNESPDAIGHRLKEIIDDNPDKTIVVDTPIPIKEFSLYEGGWVESDGKTLTPFSKKLMERNHGDQRAAMEDWLLHGSEIDGVRGPDPEKTAQRYERGLQKLEQFAKQYAGNRPYVTGVVGHSFDSDAYLTSLVGEGKVSEQAYERLSAGKGMIRETEKAIIDVDPDFTTVKYRGRLHRSRGLERIAAGFAIGGLVLALASFSGITGSVVGNSASSTSLGIIFTLITIIAATFLVHSKKEVPQMTLKFLRK